MVIVVGLRSVVEGIRPTTPPNPVSLLFVIDQCQPVIESFYKREENVWEISRAEGLDQTFPIKSLDLSLSLADLYAEVTFPPPETEE